MNKNDISNHNNNKRISENNKSSSNYFRCASVEEKNNNFKVSHDLEKEFLDVTYLVKNSVEKINTLFNNKEFKKKTLSKKKIGSILSNKININQCNPNKESIFMDEKSDSKRTFKKFLNTSQKDKNLSKYYVNEEDEDIYNNNDLFEELKNLNSNRIKNGNSKRNNVSSKNNIYENDFVNNTLLNLESNKLYHKNINLKKVNTIDSANVTQKNKDKKVNNTNITNQVKNEKKNDSIILKDKKRDTLKNTQKGNIKLPKNKQNNADSTKYRNSCKPKVVFDKHIVEETKNKFSKTSRNKFLNGSLPKGRISRKKINSNKMLIDTNNNNNNNMSIETNYLNTNTNMNDNNFNKTKREENHLLLSIGKHLYKGQNRVLAMNESGRSNKNNSNKKKILVER